MTDNNCCFYDSGVFENVKLRGYSYRINRGDNVTLELNTNKRALHLFVNNVIQPLCITNVPLQCCFLTVSVGKTDWIEFNSLLHAFDPIYSVEFLDEDRHVNWFYRNYLKQFHFNKFLFNINVFFVKYFILSTKEKKFLVEMTFFFVFIKNIIVVVVDVSNHSVHVFEHLRKG
jgi:uncharacterized membrane protein YoaT (DUF817 family)